MPTPDFSIKTGDTSSAVYATLEDADGVAVDIGAASVVFKMSPISGGTTVVAAAATNAQVGAGTIDGSTGDVVFNWGASVPGTAGLYCAEWEVTFTSGSIQTFPNSGYMLVDVYEGL